MKKLLFTGLLGLALVLPNCFSATTHTTTSTTELTNQKQKKKKSRKNKSKSSKPSKASPQNRKCTYNGHPLYRGSRGGCYYMAGNSKEYVDRSYCSDCN